MRTIGYVPVDVLTTPREGDCMVARWWVVHPTKGVLFSSPGKSMRHWAPQCNRNRAVSEMIRASLYPDCELLRIEVAYPGHSIGLLIQDTVEAGT